MIKNQSFYALITFLICVCAHSQIKVNDTTLYYRIDTYLSVGIQNGFSGAIAVVSNGKTIINKGYGFADKNKDVLNNPKTLFDIGSNTKQFTATAIMKLFEMGKLTLQDPLKIYFNDLPKDKQSITIHQLLSHTSGLEDAVGKDFEDISQDDYFKEVFSSELLTEPGTAYSYSNIGYSVLGRIIELVSEEDYETFLSKHFFIPAGMGQTGYLLPKWNTNEISRSYNRGILEDESPILKYQKNGEINWYLKANGGINSTQNDMLLWYEALKSNLVISNSSFEKLTTPYSQHSNEKSGYGYGWDVSYTDENIKWINHNGSNGAYSHSIIWFTKEDIFIVYATNANSSKVEFLAYDIAKMILDEDYVPHPIQNNVYAYAIGFIRQNSEVESDKLIELLGENYTEELSTPRTLNSIGNILLMLDENIDWAIALFKENVFRYPNDGNLWDSLGDAYAFKNDIENAVKSYQKAVEQGYDSSKEKLAKLKS